MLNKVINFQNGHITWGGATAGAGDGLYNIGVDGRSTNNAGDGLRPNNVFIRGGLVAGNIFNLNAPYGINNAGARGIVAAGDAMANTVALMGGSTVLYGGTQTFHGFAKDTSFGVVPAFFNLNASPTDYDVYFGALMRFSSNVSLMKFGNNGNLSLLSATGALVNFQQIPTPANPAAGTNSLYFKSDGSPYYKNSSGIETKIDSSPSGAYVDLLAQTGSIGTVTLFTPSSDGLFQISTYANATTTDASAVLTVTISWTDDSGTQSTAVVSSMPFAVAKTASQSSLIIKAKSGVPVQYSSTLSGATTAAYTLVIAGTTLGLG